MQIQACASSCFVSFSVVDFMGCLPVIHFSLSPRSRTWCFQTTIYLVIRFHFSGLSPCFKGGHMSHTVLRRNSDPGHREMHFFLSKCPGVCLQCPCLRNWNYHNHCAMRKDSLWRCHDTENGILKKWSCSSWIKANLKLTYLWNHCLCEPTNYLFFSWSKLSLLHSLPWISQIPVPFFNDFSSNVVRPFNSHTWVLSQFATCFFHYVFDYCILRPSIS